MEDRKEYYKEWRKNHPEYYTSETWKIYNKAREKRKHWEWKLLLIKTLGGKCNKCDEAHPICLVFHHMKLNDKETKKEWKRKSFMDKVKNGDIMLLCANCHRKLHNPDILEYLEREMGFEPTKSPFAEAHLTNQSHPLI